MSEKIDGRRGEILRFAKGARNWFISQMSENIDEYSWIPPDGGKSAAEIVNHVAWVISAICSKMAYDLGLEIHVEEPVSEGVEGLKNEITMAYGLVESFLSKLKDEDLDKTAEIPPPSRIREGQIETVLRVLAGYHAIHHAGQIAMTLRRARGDFEDND